MAAMNTNLVGKINKSKQQLQLDFSKIITRKRLDFRPLPGPVFAGNSYFPM